MDPFDRFTRRSLRDVLVTQGVITPEQAEDLVDAARSSEDPLGMVVVEAGHMTSWDLMKTVASQYQMPALPLHGFRFDSSLCEDLSPSMLHQHKALPVGRFGAAWSFATMEPPTRATIEDLRAACGDSLFFFVADGEELRRLLREHVKVVDVTADTGWQSIFDEAEQNVKKPKA